MEKIIASLKQYWSHNSENQKESDQIISWIEKYREFAFKRENLEWHITGSLLVTNLEKTRVLLMFHKKLQLWLQFGWHADGDMDILAVAIREFHEESGIDIEPKIMEWIFNVHIHDIPENRWVPVHKHFDILYLGMIAEDIPFSRQESEVDDIRWFDIEGIEKYIGEKRMLDMIHQIKLISHV